MKILLATDGSRYSDAAAKVIASQHYPNGIRVQVLRVVEPAVYSSPPQMAAGYAPEMSLRLAEQVKEAKESVERTAEVLRQAGFRAEPRVIESEIRAGILDVAAEFGADLIVIGSHGEKGLRRFLIGSVAEFVARHAPCSVLIVRIRPDS